MTILALLAGAVGGFVAGVYASVVLVGLMPTERVPETTTEHNGAQWTWTPSEPWEYVQ